MPDSSIANSKRRIIICFLVNHDCKKKSKNDVGFLVDHDCTSFGMAFRSNLRGDGFWTQSLPRAGFTTPCPVGRLRRPCGD